MKFPDSCFLFEDPDTLATTPMIMFEAGFSEKYQDLLEDARDWLLYTRGKVRLVVLLEIQADLPLKRAYQKTKQSKERIRKLLTKYGNAKGKEIHDVAEDSDPTLHPIPTYTTALKNRGLGGTYNGVPRALESWAKRSMSAW
jgi:hypothetical protein